MTALADLTATEAANRLAAGTLTARELVEACLGRIAERDPQVEAWSYLNPEYARAQAEACDRAMRNGGPIGPLHGLPVGIKDIIDTADMPTENGCAMFEGHQPEQDAVCVARLRACGAIIMGKTVTTELATRSPGKTRHPQDPKRTPGGSSSGSAAAVAAGMVPLALGTQTVGSVIRPASFCGIYGLKPTLGLIPRRGVTLQSHTLDTVGVYARSVDDLALLTDALDSYDPADDVSYPRAPSAIADVGKRPFAGKLRLGFLRTPAWDRADAKAREAVSEFVAGLSGIIENATLPAAFDTILDHHVAVQYAENIHHFRPLLDRDPTRLTETLRANLADGAKVTAEAYLAALAAREPLHAIITNLLATYDALVCLSATGPAPEGLGWTGDPIFNGMWTYLGVPTVSLPLLDIDGLPLGVTLVGPRRGEGRLLRVARAFEVVATGAA
ncbi:MAG: amidase [Hyphomicrobiaceae bacterium]